MARSSESIDALVTLAKLYRLDQRKLPENIHVCVAGCTEMVHPTVHQHYDQEKEPSPLSTYMAAPRSGESFILIQMNKFGARGDIQGVWNHTLDGRCMLDSYRKGYQLDPLQNVSIGVLLLLIVWLQSLSDIHEAHIVFMCAQGKHRSMYVSHLVVLALRLVFAALKLDVKVMCKWAAGGRVLGEIESDKQLRQIGPVTHHIGEGWLRHYGGVGKNPRMFVLNLTDANYKAAFGTDEAADNFNLGSWMNNLELLPIGNLFAWIDENKVNFVKHSKNVLQSWHHFVRHVVIFPEFCSICLNGQWEWPKEPLEHFASLVENIRGATNEDSPMKALSPARKRSRKRWSESDSDDEDATNVWANKMRTDASSVPLRAAGAGQNASSGVSLRTASAAGQSDVTLRPILKKTNATSAGVRKSARFEENTNDAEPTQRASEFVFWHLQVCLERKVVLSFGVSHLTEAEAEKNCLLRQAQSKMGPFYLLTHVESSSEAPAQIKFAEQLVAESELLQEELQTLWVVAQNANIPIEQQDMKNRLQEIELFLFLHMVSILMDYDTLPFTVSCYFLSYVGQHFRYRLDIDIMELMARFVYYVWLSPAMDAITWNSWPALLFPGNCSRIESWWEKLQMEFRVDSDEGFCEEYWCVRERVQRLVKSGVPLPAADGGSSGSAATSGVPLRAAGGAVQTKKKKEEKKNNLVWKRNWKKLNTDSREAQFASFQRYLI